jgi:predicted PurR-regulated permease PerM
VPGAAAARAAIASQPHRHHDRERVVTDHPPLEAAAHSTPPGPAFVGRVLTTTAIVIALLLLVLLLWVGREVVLMMFAGLLLAVLLRFASNALSHYTGLGDRLSISLVLLLVVTLAVLAGMFAGPGIVEEVKQLQSGLGESVRDVREQVQQTRIGAWVTENAPEMNDDEYRQMWSRLGGFSATAVGALSGFMIVLFVGVFFAFNPGLYLSGMLRLFPVPRRARIREVAEQITVTLRWWLAGQLISMVFLWLSTWLALHLLGVPLAFILGLLTGLLTFIPYIGPLIAIIPIAMVAFLESPTLALTAVGVYFVIQNVEANVLMPLVFQRLVHLPPALTIAAQILMGTLAGIIGVVLATPLLAVVMVLIRTLYVEDVLRDDMDRPALPEEPDLQPREHAVRRLRDKAG